MRFLKIFSLIALPFAVLTLPLAGQAADQGPAADHQGKMEQTLLAGNKMGEDKGKDGKDDDDKDDDEKDGKDGKDGKKGQGGGY